MAGYAESLELRSAADFRSEINFLRLGLPGLLHCWESLADSYIRWSAHRSVPSALDGFHTGRRVLTLIYTSSYGSTWWQSRGGKRSQRSREPRAGKAPKTGIYGARQWATRRRPQRKLPFFSANSAFSGLFRVPAPFNLHLRNARTEVRCTVSRPLFCT